MKRLIDVHAPQHDVADALVLHVDAAPEVVLDVVDSGMVREPFAGVDLLGIGRGERLYGLTWHPVPGADGVVDVVWDIRVQDDGEGGTYLSSTRRFTASDDDARAAFRASWRQVRASAAVIARRTLRSIKDVAEEDTVFARQAGLLLAA